MIGAFDRFIYFVGQSQCGYCKFCMNMCNIPTVLYGLCKSCKFLLCPGKLVDIMQMLVASVANSSEPKRKDRGFGRMSAYFVVACCYDRRSFKMMFAEYVEAGQTVAERIIQDGPRIKSLPDGRYETGGYRKYVF